MARFIGCDLGGTNIKAGMVDPDTGALSQVQSVPTLSREGPAAVIQRIVALVNQIISASGLARSEFKGVGVGVPGALDLEKGETIFLPNLPGNWPHIPLAATIRTGTGLPCFLLNDVRSITYGEWKFGAGRDADTMACFAIGTGIGGGLVINGQLHLGIGGTAGELGHQIIDPNGPHCGCGAHGCLETFASGPAISAMGMKAVAQGLTTRIGQMVNFDLNKITPEVICEAAKNGDPIAHEIFETAGMYLGIGISNILIAIGPRKVVIGGGVAAAGDLLLNPIRRTIKERVFLMPRDEVEIVLAELGNSAGVVGAACWAEFCLEQE